VHYTIIGAVFKRFSNRSGRCSDKIYVSFEVVEMKNRVLIRLFLSIVFIVATSTAIANEGNCLLKIVAANDLAKTASVYINDKLEGTLESGELTIFDLDVGNHIITLDGELIEKHELEVVFQSTYESKRVDLEANPGKRAVRITSEPSNAAIRIDNEWLEQKTPWQITLEVGRTYEIELFKELHGSKTQSLLVPRKGEIIFLHAEIPKADPPKKPFLLYPEDKSVHLEERVVELTWESLDDSLQFEIEFDGKVHTTSNNIARFYSLERGKTYFWRVTAVNRYGMKTTSEQYSFTMQPNRLPEITSVYPQNESSDVFADVITLTWEVTDADGDRVTHDVYFGDSFDSLVKVRSNSTLNEFKLQELERGKTYYWKIVATDSFGAVMESSINAFSTKPNIPPVIDDYAEILLEETDRDVSAELKWFSVDPDNDHLVYDVYFGTDKEPSLLLVNYEQSTLLKTNLDFDTTYYWQIIEKDEHGGISKGPLWEFTTKNPPSYIPSDIVPKMVFVEKGSFTMGDTWGDGDSREKPIHKVTFTYNFYISKYETTFDEYDAFCEATGRSKPGDWGWGRGQRPVVDVSWWDAIAYCNWLSEKEDLPKAYDSDGNLLDKDGMITTDPSKVVGYRLPTEAEWEYAARGGNKSKGYKYAGSDNIDDVAWYWDNAGMKTQEVGKKSPNELDLYDMSGNVYEWCSDWYGDYSGSAQINPYNSTVGSYRVIRGGSWSFNAADSRVAIRLLSSPTHTRYFLGFRICRTVLYTDESRFVQASNRPPVISITPRRIAEGEVLTIDLTANSSDPDNDRLSYTRLSGPGTVQGSVYTLRTDFNSAGNYTVIIRADDGKGGRTSGSFALEVRDVNRPPLLELSDITVPEGSTYSINLTEVSSDPDGDTLTYSIIQGIGRIENNNYIVEPDYDSYGFYTVVIRASDGKGGQVSSTFDLLVADTNRAPLFTIPDQTTMSTRTLRLDLRELSSDPDGDYLRYELVYGPGLLTGSIYSFTPEELGTSTLMLKASDLKGGETTTTFTITVR